MAAPTGYTQLPTGEYMKNSDGSGPYVFDGTTMLLSSTGTGGGGSGGTSDATAANQTTQITAEQAMQATLGATTDAAVITDANGTIQQYLRGLIVKVLALIALLPASIGVKLTATSLSTTIATDDAVMGALTETAPATDTASSGLNGRMQRLAQRMSSLIALFTATAASDANRLPVSQLDALTIAPVSLTATGTLFTQDLTGYASISVQVTSAGTTCTITYETSDDNTNWSSTSGLFPGTVGTSTPFTTTTGGGVFVFPRTGRYFRARVSTYTSGTVTVTAVASQTPVTGFGAQHTVLIGSTSAGMAAEDAAFTSGNTGSFVLGNRQDSRASPVSADGDYHALTFDAFGRLKVNAAGSASDWSVASALTDGTAATIKASAGAGIRNRLCSVQVSHTLLGAATVLAIRDGAAGTVLWQVALDTSLNQGTSFPINPPISGSNATLMEVVLLTTPTTGTVYACVQGDIITS